MIPHRRKLCATSLTLVPKLDRVALRIVYASKAAGLPSPTGDPDLRILRCLADARHLGGIAWLIVIAPGFVSLDHLVAQQFGRR